MKTYNVFKYRDSYNDSMYSVENRIKSLWAVPYHLDKSGFAILMGRPINRAEGAAQLATVFPIKIGTCELISLHPEMGGLLHIQVDARREDEGQFITNLMRCINFEKSRVANDHTNYIRFLLKERS